MLQVDPKWHWQNPTARVELFGFELDFCPACACNYTIITGDAQGEILGNYWTEGGPIKGGTGNHSSGTPRV